MIIVIRYSVFIIARWQQWSPPKVIVRSTSAHILHPWVSSAPSSPLQGRQMLGRYNNTFLELLILRNFMQVFSGSCLSDMDKTTIMGCGRGRASAAGRSNTAYTKIFYWTLICTVNFQTTPRIIGWVSRLIKISKLTLRSATERKILLEQTPFVAPNEGDFTLQFHSPIIWGVWKSPNVSRCMHEMSSYESSWNAEISCKTFT